MKNAYDRLLEVKKETGKNIGDLLAMSHVNDPCYFGSPKDIKLAEWFRDNVFNRYAETRGGSVYIRGLHYWYSGLEDAVKPDGTPYEHDRKSWILLKRRVRPPVILDMLTRLGLRTINTQRTHRLLK